jgi:hypothetical protein
VADGYIGQMIDFELNPSDSVSPIGVELKPRPPLTDAEYRLFGTQFQPEVDVNEMMRQSWSDPTLVNLLMLELYQREQSPRQSKMIEDLEILTDAGDEVAQTTLYYAALEGLIPRARLSDYLLGLDAASNKNYALATMLQALHILNELTVNEKSLANDAATKMKLEELAKQMIAQGMEETGRLIELLIEQQLARREPPFR